MRRLFFLLIFVSALAVPLRSALAETRIALVIGNGAYAQSPLRNPANDARLMAAKLRELGFQVIERIDVDQNNMKRAIVDFGDALERAGSEAVALFYYAGHGVQVNGANYLIPLKARIEREKDVEIEAVNAAWVLGQMEYANGRMNIVVLDACRNNPFVNRSFRSAARGLARMDAPRGSLIAYSTAPGNVALDGVGDNSPYTAALVQAMSAPGLAVEQVFKEARRSVVSATEERQTPWESSSLVGDFYFSSAAATVAQTRPAVAAPAPAGGGLTEAKAFELAKSIDTRDAWDAFLQQFPHGSYAPFAEAARAKHAAPTQMAARPVPAAPQSPPAPAVPALATAGFIFPYSDRQYLTEAEVRALPRDRLRYARNEIFARKGRFFKTESLKSYFSQFGWYRPHTWDVPLTEVEKANVNLIKSVEDGR
ncbi:MAG: caspase family protein [Magnetospiraceae bacterium]